MFFISIIIGSTLGLLIGGQFISDPKTPEGELGMIAWALVGVIAGCLASVFLGYA